MNKFSKEKNVTRLTVKPGSKCSSPAQAQEIPATEQRFQALTAFILTGKSKEASVKKRKKKFFFNGQIIKIQRRRQLCGAVDRDPDRRPLAHSSSWSVCVLNLPRMADPEQLYLTSSGLSEAVGCMQLRLGTEAWGHEEVTRPENVGFHLPKDRR